MTSYKKNNSVDIICAARFSREDFHNFDSFKKESREDEDTPSLLCYSLA